MFISPNNIECPVCGNKMNPVWFTEEETETEHGIMYKTGRKRMACSHLACEYCGHMECVDDSFDKPWHN